MHTASGGGRPRSTDARQEAQLTKWQKSTMLALLAALADGGAGERSRGRRSRGVHGRDRHGGEHRRDAWRPAATRRSPRCLQDFKDDDLYFLAPGGDFEDGAEGWQLEGGARSARGSNAFSPLGSGQRSLQLPAGSAATSPAFCVDERYPHFRDHRRPARREEGQVRVSVVYPGPREERPQGGRRRRRRKHRVEALEATRDQARPRPQAGRLAPRRPPLRGRQGRSRRRRARRRHPRRPADALLTDRQGVEDPGPRGLLRRQRRTRLPAGRHPAVLDLSHRARCSGSRCGRSTCRRPRTGARPGR